MKTANKEISLEQLHKKLRFYRSLSACLAVLLFGVVLVKGFLYGCNLWEKYREDSVLGNHKSPPYKEKVMEIMKPLVYSGFKSLQRSDVQVTINFKQKIWRIYNFHHFDANGQILLQDGREGLCGQLSDYMRWQLQPIFGKEYTFEFVRAAEHGYFLDYRSSHYVLKITHKSKKKVYYCDPTFKRYGTAGDFEDYLFSTVSPELDFIKARDPDFVANVEFGVPILIRKGFIVDLLVDEVAGKFDPDNFALAITCNQQYKFSGRRIFSVKMYHGVPYMDENVSLAEWLLPAAEYAGLKRRLCEWFKEMSGVDPLPKKI